jgi:hypothetical protein
MGGSVFLTGVLFGNVLVSGTNEFFIHIVASHTDVLLGQVHVGPSRNGKQASKSNSGSFKVHVDL